MWSIASTQRAWDLRRWSEDWSQLRRWSQEEVRLRTSCGPGSALPIYLNTRARAGWSTEGPHRIHNPPTARQIRRYDPIWSTYALIMDHIWGHSARDWRGSAPHLPSLPMSQDQATQTLRSSPLRWGPSGPPYRATPPEPLISWIRADR